MCEHTYAQENQTGNIWLPFDQLYVLDYDGKILKRVCI
jgi:hypothetical protein